MQPLLKVLSAPPVQHVVVDPLPYILLSNPQIQGLITHKTHPQHCTVNLPHPPNYPIASPSFFLPTLTFIIH